MSKIQKPGIVGNRMTAAQKEAANQARLAKAAKQAAKASTKTKAAKAVKSAFRKVQSKKIALAVFVGLIPTDLVEPTWDNIDQFTTQVIADEQVAPVVSNPVKVKVSYNKPKAKKNLTGTRADKFAPSAPSEVIEEAIPKASSDFLKDALRKAMYNAFYEEQSLALEAYYEASRSSIAARYEQQYKDYKLSLVDAINSVVVETDSIKAKAKQDVILAYEADEAKYEKDWQQWFEDNKSSAIDEVLQEVELPIDSSLVIALIEEAKEAEEAAKVVAVKEQTAKKLAAIEAYNNKQKAEAKQSFADKHLASLAKAKKEIFFYSKVVTAQAAKAVVSNCSSVAKMNKEQAKQYLDLFLELQSLVKKAKDVAGPKEFTAVLNAIYKVGSALSALYKTLSNELGYSFDDALENILGSNLQELNSIESIKSLSEKEKTNRRVIVVALDKLESK